MNYREVRAALNALAPAHDFLRTAILAEDTRDVAEPAGAAQSIAAGVRLTLEQLLHSVDLDSAAERVKNRELVEQAQGCLDEAVVAAQSVALAGNMREIRDGLLDVKTKLDFADAYLTAAISEEE